MRNIVVRDAPCWDPNVLNASCKNCYYHPCANKTSVPEQNDEKCLYKRDIENPNEYLSVINFRGDHVIKLLPSTSTSILRYPKVCVSKEQRI